MHGTLYCDLHCHFSTAVLAADTMCRYGGLWKNLHKADKVPDHLQRSDIQAEELQALEATPRESKN